MRKTTRDVAVIYVLILFRGSFASSSVSLNPPSPLKRQQRSVDIIKDWNIEDFLSAVDAPQSRIVDPDCILSPEDRLHLEAVVESFESSHVTQGFKLHQPIDEVFDSKLNTQTSGTVQYAIVLVEKVRSVFFKRK